MIPLIAAALIAASPATIDAAIAGARPGDTIRLQRGDYPVLAIRKRQWPVALTIDARGANFPGLKFDDVVGVHLQGGRFNGTVSEPHWVHVVNIETSQDIVFKGSEVNGTGAAGFGLFARRSSGVVVDDVAFKGLHTAIQFSEVTDSRIVNSTFDGLRSDGMNIAGSQRILIEKNECSNFSPRVPVDHPDCVQLWSIRGKPPTADIEIRGNRATGRMQGFSGFDHGEGGFDRVTIVDNIISNSYPQAIALNQGRGVIVANNRVETQPGAWWASAINITDSKRVAKRANRVVTPDPRTLRPPARGEPLRWPSP